MLRWCGLWEANYNFFLSLGRTHWVLLTCPREPLDVKGLSGSGKASRELTHMKYLLDSAYTSITVFIKDLKVLFCEVKNNFSLVEILKLAKADL